MMRVLQAVGMFLRRAPWAAAPEWTEVDERALRGFLGTSTGRKLMGTITQEIAVANERAAMSKGAAFECGWACGYRGLLAWFQALAGEAETVEVADEEGEGD